MDASPNPTNNTEEKSTPTTNNAAATQPTAAPQTAVDTGPKSYLVMMLLAVFTLPTGLARAYLGEQVGWTRFWVFIASYVLLLVPLLNLVAGLVVLGLFIWGIVDLFTLRKRTTDATGKELVSTPRDKKWAKGFFIYAVVAMALGVLLFVFGVAIGLWAATSAPSFEDSYTYPSSEMDSGEWNRFLDELESQSN